MSEYSNQRTWSFSHLAAVQSIDAIEDPQRRAEAIVGVLRSYSSVRDEWQAVVKAHPQGLDKRKTHEYAAMLGCAATFESVVTASYNLLNVWPAKTVALLEATLELLNIRGEIEGLFRAIEWDRLSERYYFDIRRVMATIEDMADVTLKIKALEQVRESLLAHGSSGSLILIDPESGEEMQPEEDRYGDVVVAALRDFLDPELYRLRTIPYVAARRSGTPGEYDPHEVGLIRWSAPLEHLSQLLRDLVSYDLIDCSLDDLPSVAACHFGDKFERVLTHDELREMFGTQARGGPAEDCGPILWKSEQAPLTHLVFGLAENGFIGHKPSSYLDLIIAHFAKPDGSAFSRRSLTASKNKIQSMKQPTETVAQTEQVLTQLKVAERRISSPPIPS